MRQQYESLQLKIAQYSQVWSMRKSGDIVVAIRAYSRAGDEIVIDEQFLKGKRVCASVLWEHAYYDPHGGG